MGDWGLREWWHGTVDPWIDRVFPDRAYLGNPIERWLLALVILVVALIGLRVVKGLIRLRAAAIAERRRSDLAKGVVRLLDATRFWFLLGAAVFLASLALVLGPRAETVIRTAAAVLLVLQAAVWGSVFIAFATDRYAEKRRATDAASVTMMAAVAFLGRVALWSVATLLVLENVGVDVTALVAGLGVGGIAVALAAQNILGDLFASLSIVLDKPFVLGDFIVVGETKGTVEHIGLKSTRLRSLSGEQLIVSNNDLLKSRIQNFKRMAERRVVFSVGVAYETPLETLRAIPGILRDAILAQQPVRFDRAHFQKYGDWALIYEAVYFVLSGDYNQYMDVQQGVNFTVFERFAREGIEFAYPTQAVLAKRGAADGAAPPPEQFGRRSVEQERG